MAQLLLPIRRSHAGWQNLGGLVSDVQVYECGYFLYEFGEMGFIGAGEGEGGFILHRSGVRGAFRKTRKYFA